MQSVDTSRISHNLPARMSYLQSFIKFEPDRDGNLITSCKPYFTSDVLNAINDMIINKILEYDITRVPFASPSPSGEGGCKVEDLHRQHPNIKYSRFGQKLLGGILANDNWSPTGQFWTYFDKVGRVHIGVDDTGLPSRKNKPPLKVHIREISLLIGLLEDEVIDVLMHADDLNNEQKSARIKAWNKYWWIQNDLFAKHQSVGYVE